MSLITEELYRQMGIRRSVVTFGESVCEELKERFDVIDAIAEYNQLKVIHAMQKNSNTLPQTAAHCERSHITRLFSPHKIQFVIQAGYGMERFLRHSFSPFPEYHKCDTIIRTFKFYNIVFPILSRYLGQGSLIGLP